VCEPSESELVEREACPMAPSVFVSMSVAPSKRCTVPIGNPELPTRVTVATIGVPAGWLPLDGLTATFVFGVTSSTCVAV
jgi:hypothetical protein